MLTKAQNKLVTETGPDTRAGRLMRRYWQPAALSAELDQKRPVVRVRLLGEDLVLFRDPAGQIGLIGQHCPHRGADLCFGRLEDGGLRCPFHGWLFDVGGTCLEQPAEPVGSAFHTKIRHTAYPCIERNGIIFAFLGEGEPIGFPELDCLSAPEAFTFAFKGWIESNWLQALEVGIDPAHASFLHRFLEDEDPMDGYGKQFRSEAGETDIPITQILRRYPRPDIRVAETGYGLQITSLRNLDNQGMHVRVTNQVFPNAIVIPMSNDMTITQWQVPIDDANCYWYAIFTSFTDPVDHAKMRAQRLELYQLPEYRPRLNRSNHWGYDADEQENSTYTGMGLDINVHDQWAVESPGAVQDRTREHLGTSDIAITTYRRMLKNAISSVGKGRDPALKTTPAPPAEIGPPTFDTIAPVEGWSEHWISRETERRRSAPWRG